MPLAAHLRELRRRIIVSALAVAAGGVVGWIYYPELIAWLTRPLRELAREQGREVANINFGASITQPFSMQLKVAFYSGIVISSPVWLLQIWGFVVPGLKKRERRAALGFLAVALPLFLGGCALAVWVLPGAVKVLLGFTPSGAVNLLDAGIYLSFVLQFVVAFGLGMVLPALLLALNVMGVLPARIMLRAWRVAVVLIFVFAAVMTPDPSAWSMLLLALPMTLLFFVAVAAAFLNERRRARAASAEPEETTP